MIPARYRTRTPAHADSLTQSAAVSPMNARGDLELGRLQPQQALSTLHTFHCASPQRGFQSMKFTACPPTPDTGLKSSSPHPQLGQTYDRSIRPNG